MIVSLEEVKLFLRVDNDDENMLIINFIKVAEELVEGILRYELTEFEIVPAIIKQSILYAVANMYEKRDDFNSNEIIEFMVRLLFQYRREEF